MTGRADNAADATGTAGADASGNGPPQKPSFLAEGTLLGAATAVGYLVTYLHELGYCHVFGIPSTFISVDVSRVAFAALTVAGSLLLILAFMNFAPLAWRYRHPIVRPVLITGGLAIGMLSLWLLAGFDAHPAFGVFVVAVFAATEFLSPFIYKDVKGYRAKMEHLDKIEASQRGRTLWGRYAPKGLGMLVSLTMVAGTHAYALGTAHARKQVDFLVDATAVPPKVVLRLYGNVLISSPLDRERRLVPREFHFSKIEESKPLRLEPVGPLQVQK